MGEHTNIGWTDHTFNPWVGCQRVSAGCTFCYAESWAKRSGLVQWGAKAERRVTSDANWRKPLKWNDQATANGRRDRVFCASLADVFEGRPELDEPRRRLFELIDSTPHLVWQLLTKRPHNVAAMVPATWLSEHTGQPAGWPDNVWIGTTIEDQRAAEERIPTLLELPAPVRFLSCEPLLGFVHLTNLLPHRCECGATLPPLHRWHHGGSQWGHIECGACGRLTVDEDEFFAVHEPDPDTERCCEPVTPIAPRSVDWVICGGESGPRHRPLDLRHARHLRDQCSALSIPYYFKQLGGRTPSASGDLLDGHQHKAIPSAAAVQP